MHPFLPMLLLAVATSGATNATLVSRNDNLVSLFYLQVPATVDRAVPFPVVVQALNADHSVAAGYRGTIHFTPTRSEQLPPDYTFTASDAGTHTFNVTATKGQYSWFYVTDAADSSVSGASGQIAVNCPELTVTASNSGPICPSGGAAVLSASPSLPVVDTHWFSSIGHPPVFDSHQQNPIVTSPYTYIVVVTASNDCQATAQTTVFVHQPDSFVVSVSPAQVCDGTNITASLTNAGPFQNIQWSASGGSIVNGQGTPSVIVAPAPGSSSVSLSISARETSSGCAAAQSLAPIPVSSGDYSAHISTVASMCAQTTQTASVPDAGAGASYVWTIANGTIVSGQGTRTISYTAAGSSSVTLTAAISNGSCRGDGSAVVSTDGPTAMVHAHIALCADTEATIPVTLAGVPPFRIVWSDGFVQSNITTTTTARSVSNSGVYSIVELSDANCSGVATGTADVLFTSPPAIAVQPQDATVPPGQTATLSVTAAGSDLHYAWYEGAPGDRTRLVGSGATFTTPHLGQTASYWVEVTNGCGAAASRAAVVTVAVPGKRRAVRH